MTSQWSSGIASAIGAYGLWGILPIYWKLVADVPAQEILAHRIIWSFVFMSCLILAIKGQRQFVQEVREIVFSSKRLLIVIAGASLISLNWFIYIWAVNDNRMIETSLGYYINPLVNVMLGILVLKERLSFWQAISIGLAGCGVLYMTWQVGSIPLVAVLLASSFALYGLCKKLVRVTAITGVTLETILITPISLVYLIYLNGQGVGTFHFQVTATTVFLMATGVITAVPLLLFANGANRLPLILLGLIQYLSPSITLLLGIFLYHEPFTQVHLISFSCIWLALAIFSLSGTSFFVKAELFFRRKLYPANH